MYLDEKKSGERILERTDLERFIAWAQTRDPGERYIYTDPSDCLIARWDKSEGHTRLRLSSQVEALFGGSGLHIAQYYTPDKYRTIAGALRAALRIQKVREKGT